MIYYLNNTKFSPVLCLKQIRIKFVRYPYNKRITGRFKPDSKQYLFGLSPINIWHRTSQQRKCSEEVSKTIQKN